MRLKKNEAVAASRRILVPIYDADQLPLDPMTDLSSATVLVSQASPDFVAAGGTLTNARKPLVVADFAYTADATTNLLTKVGHTLLTGDGPFTTTNSGGALPGGLAAATPYYIIRDTDNTFRVASSRPNAIAGTFIDITTNGTGTQTWSDGPTTQRLWKGRWVYEATQAELDFAGSFFGLSIEGDAILPVSIEADMYELEVDMDSGMGGKPWGDIHRGNTAVLVGTSNGYQTGLINWICPFTGKTRWTHTIVPDGRSVAAEGDLT